MCLPENCLLRFEIVCKNVDKITPARLFEIQIEDVNVLVGLLGCVIRDSLDVYKV